MSLAWETTIEDVINALALDGRTVAEAEAEKYHDDLDHDEIEKSALYGNDMETQTEYALVEIQRQVRCLDEIKKTDEAKETAK